MYSHFMLLIEERKKAMKFFKNSFKCKRLNEERILAVKVTRLLVKKEVYLLYRKRQNEIVIAQS